MARSRDSRGRMPKHWENIGSTSATAFTATSTAVIGGSLTLDEAWTVIRIIGEYTVRGVGTLAAGDKALIGVGVAVVSGDAATLGGTAVPDPIGEPEYPWLYWAVHPMAFESADVDSPSATASIRHVIDIRSMRKVKPRESLIIIAEYLDGNGAPPVDFHAARLRVLLAQ